MGETEISSISPKNHAESCGGHCLLGVPVRGLIPVTAFADDERAVAIDALLALFALLAEPTTDVLSSGIPSIARVGIVV